MELVLEKIDNDMLAEFKLVNPSEEKIREFVSAGADIKGGFLMYIFQHLLDEHDENKNTGNAIFEFTLNIKTVELLIDLGAEPNYTEDGFICLWEACCYCESPELVDILVKRFVNKNCVSTETKETLLDALKFELWYREDIGKGGGAKLSKCIDMLVYHGAETGWNKDLWKELESPNRSEERIRELVAKGANIKGEFSSEMHYPFESKEIPEGWNSDRYYFNIDFKIIQLLIDLGVDLNYLDEGFGCIWEACVGCWNPQYLELLLKNGADPNPVLTETPETILDYVIGDQWHEGHSDEEPLGLCVKILKQYGAKHYSELFPDEFGKIMQL